MRAITEEEAVAAMQTVAQFAEQTGQDVLDLSCSCKSCYWHVLVARGPFAAPVVKNTADSLYEAMGKEG